MTEHNERLLESYTYTPVGSLWMDEPTFWRDTPAVDWDKTVEVLYHLLPLGESINQAMLIAIGDAESRAREELKRAIERENSEKDEYGLSPGEVGRLEALMNRSDALNNARVMIEDHVPEGVRGSTLGWLEKLQEEAEEEYEHYRRGLGLSEPPEGGSDDV